MLMIVNVSEFFFNYYLLCSGLLNRSEGGK
jgi:hypothetical protein